MSVSFSPLEGKEEWEGVILFGFSLEEKNRQYNLVPHSIAPFKNEKAFLGDLTNVTLAVSKGQALLLRSADVSGQKQMEELSTLIQELKKGFFRPSFLRICSLQLDSVRKNWNEILLQHQFLLGDERGNKNSSFLHLSFPVELFEESAAVSRRIARESPHLNHLSHLINVEAWRYYCHFFDEELKKVFRTFSYAAIEEYALEKTIEDFHHEVDSTLLKRLEGHLKDEEKKRRGKEYGDSVSLLTEEKRMIRLREEFFRMIKAHFEVLSELIERIVPILPFFPQLGPIKRVATLLHRLLEDQIEIKEYSWPEKVLILGLLNQELGLFAFLSCKDGFSQTSFAFSLLLALHSVKKSFLKEEIIEAIFQWEEKTKFLNRFYAKNGARSTLNWLESPSREVEEKKTKKLCLIIQKLRELTLSSLEIFSLPILRLHKGEALFRGEEEVKISPILLNIFPSFRREDLIPLVRYDPLSGDPLEFTKVGLELLSFPLS